MAYWVFGSWVRILLPFKKKKAENSSTLCKNHKGRKGLPTDVIRRALTVQKLFRSGNAGRWKLIINYTSI